MLALMSIRPTLTTRPFHSDGTAPDRSVLGPPEAWDWGQVLAFCHAVARRHTASPHEAEDAAQEAAARAWRHRAACRERSDPRPWVAAIARREALRISTSRRGKAEVRLGDVPEIADDCSQLSTADDRVMMQAALATLRPVDRRVLWLRYGEDLTQPAIAQTLAVPEGTVKIRLHRARARLRSAM
jgi:RNA polymerase sigma-70 factor (ECF subfamily)